MKEETKKLVEKLDKVHDIGGYGRCLRCNLQIDSWGHRYFFRGREISLLDAIKIGCGGTGVEAIEPEAIPITISAYIAACGGILPLRIDVQEVSLKIPPLTQEGKILRLRGMGPDKSDLFLRIHIV